MVGVCVCLGESDLAGADVKWRLLAVTCRFDLDESITSADFVRTNVKAGVVAHGFGDLLDASGQVVLAFTPSSRARSNSITSASPASPERSIKRLHLEVVDR